MIGFLLSPIGRRVGALLAAAALLAGAYAAGDRNGHARCEEQREKAIQDAAKAAERITNEVDDLPDADLLDGILRQPR